MKLGKSYPCHVVCTKSFVQKLLTNLFLIFNYVAWMDGYFYFLMPGNFLQFTQATAVTSVLPTTGELAVNSNGRPFMLRLR